MATYVDNVVVTAETEENFKKTTEKLNDTGKKIDLVVNKSKTKYLIASRTIKIKCFNIEKVDNFENLGVDINLQANKS